MSSRDVELLERDYARAVRSTLCWVGYMGVALALSFGGDAIAKTMIENGVGGTATVTELADTSAVIGLGMLVLGVVLARYPGTRWYQYYYWKG